MQSLLKLALSVVKWTFLFIVGLIVVRYFIGEIRYIPSESMLPTMQIGDHFIIDRFSMFMNKQPYKRGEILVFYPPAHFMGQDLSNHPLNILGRLTGFPFLPYEPALIKRVIGLPGDQIEIRNGIGVFINGELISDYEGYCLDRPNYTIEKLCDIHGRTLTGGYDTPYGKSQANIVVPEGHLFLLGDNRSESQDSHVWGFLDQKRVIGRAYAIIYRFMERPRYTRDVQIQNKPSSY